MSPRKENTYFIVLYGDDSTTLMELTRSIDNFKKRLHRRSVKKNWNVKGFIGISEHDPKKHLKEKIPSGVKGGRPKIKFSRIPICNSKGAVKVKPHAHLLVIANPGATVEKFIRSDWHKRGLKSFWSSNRIKNIKPEDYIRMRKYIDNQYTYFRNI